MSHSSDVGGAARGCAVSMVDNPEQAKTQQLFSRTYSILNKMTGQTFHQSMKQMSQLAINTEERLKGVIDLIYEKALSEPNSSEIYANMCYCLKGLKVPKEVDRGCTLNFRKLLLNRCQKEFEDFTEVDVLKTKQNAMETGKEEGRENIEVEEDGDKSLRRYAGNVKFIGELFKVKMLTEAIVHDCVVKLLKNRDEERLWCLSVLLTTVGKDLDSEKAKPRMDQYFNVIGKIISERTTPARLRFKLQDVMDLRTNHWVHPTGDQSPTVAWSTGELQRQAEAADHRGQRGGRRGGRRGGQGRWRQDDSRFAQFAASAECGPAITAFSQRFINPQGGGAMQRPGGGARWAPGTPASRKQDIVPASSLLPEEQFHCSICLEIFTEPVTTPCGHTFCKTCITKYWDGNDPCQCPLCKKSFEKRPDIYVSIFISEMAAQFRKSVVARSSKGEPEREAARPEEVSFDICTGKKLKAVKSCLEPHHRDETLKEDKLVYPVESLEDGMCQKHKRPLELFCRTDQACVCQFCTETDHETHETVPLETECKERKDEASTKGTEVRQMIEERQRKIQQIKHSVEEAEQEIAERVEVFNALTASIQKSQAEVTKAVEEQRKEAEGLIEDLEQEISILKKRGTELEQLQTMEDHLRLLLSFPTLSTPLSTKDWSEVSIHCHVSVETARKAVLQLEETVSKEMEKLSEVKLKRIQRYAVDVTLDPEKTQPPLILSDDGKQVRHGDGREDLPDNPGALRSGFIALGKQSFSSGRFYYEVDVKGKTEWDLGVATESIIVGVEDRRWTIALRNSDEYKATNNPFLSIPLKEKPQVIGVFVDYEEGQLSFYDVEASRLIYSFTGLRFMEKIYPCFSTGQESGGKNAAPLIICPRKP